MNNQLGYDSLKFRLQTDSGMKVLDKLDKYEERSDAGTGAIYYVGSYRNLYVSTNDNGVSIRNSFATFFFGDNSRLLSRTDLNDVITKLHDELGFDFSSAPMHRIDIAGDIELRHSVSHYTKRLYGIGRMKPAFHDNTKYYKTSRRKVKLYDKGAERKAKGRKNVDEGRNILRIELSFEERIREEFGCPITLQHLSTKEGSEDIYRRWVEHCRAMSFMPCVPHLQQCSSRKEMALLVMAHGIHSLGPERLQDFIEMQEPGNRRRELGKLIDDVEGFSTSVFDTSTQELREKMEAIYAHTLRPDSVG